MALRDHSLDEKIEKAAFDEFLKNGFQNASLRKIAENADVTVGAIRTRYKTKDELFGGCVSKLLCDIEKVFKTVKASYLGAVQKGIGKDVWERLKFSVEFESEEILKVLFANYGAAVLLLCKSGGSSYENVFNDLTDIKVAESIEFFKSAFGKSPDENTVKILISLQFHSYCEIIKSGCDEDTAKKQMKAVMTYHLGGWSEVFDRKIIWEDRL